MKTFIRITFVLIAAGLSVALFWVTANPDDIMPAHLRGKCKCPPPAKNPLENVGIHICAFHLAKDDPNFVVETQHYCAPLGDEAFQCLLYDSIYKQARLIGVEYVISDRQYQQLSAEEKQYWHSHEHEIREGLLITTDQPKECDEKIMKTLLHTWGKTIHTWRDPNTSLPVGSPRLMWSATPQHSINKKDVESRDKRFNVNTEEIKKQRAQFLEPPKPKSKHWDWPPCQTKPKELQ